MVVCMSGGGPDVVGRDSAAGRWPERAWVLDDPKGGEPLPPPPAVAAVAVVAVVAMVRGDGNGGAAMVGDGGMGWVL